jgi:hypothetical protein
MEHSLVLKLKRIVSLGINLEEDNVRSFMVIARKLLDISQVSNQYLILRLFCNWAVHIEITKSNPGLRILAKINHALVSHKNSSNTAEIEESFSNQLGFTILRDEIATFLSLYSINTDIAINQDQWNRFINNLIEIIRDVPISFPPITSLDRVKRKIYNEISANPIKAGAGVISLNISLVGDRYCLIIITEDTTTLVVPMRSNFLRGRG